jgi:hypothetical protein
MSVPLGSQTTEPAADTFQRFEMDETAPSAAQGALDIGSAPAAPPQRLEQPSRLQTLDHSSALDRRAGRHLYSSAQQEVAQAGRERGHARSRQGALAIVETLHDARGCGYRRGWSIEGRTGPGALNLYKMSFGSGCSRADMRRG